MIRVLIVDDDSLARKGLKSVLPWKKYDIEIVGEAGDGLEALDFLEKNEIDLLITDLVMPKMSGFELIDSVKELYPYVNIVILTCYDEFSYIQDAMRKGAIDYIVKTKIELNKIDNLLSRITLKVSEQKKLRTNKELEKGYIRNGVLLYMHGECTVESKQVIKRLIPDRNIHIISRDAWFLPEPGEESRKIIYERLNEPCFSDWIAVNVTPTKRYDIMEISMLLLEFINNELFYDYQSAGRIYEASLGSDKRGLSNDINQEMKEEWSSLSWVYIDEKYDKLVEEVERLRPIPTKIKCMLLASIIEWNKHLGEEECVGQWIQTINTLKFWCQCKSWLLEVKDYVLQKENSCEYSEGVAASIWKAKHLLTLQYQLDLKEEEVAKTVNVSRSYFSKCFKGITGKTFRGYIKELRMEKAKDLLVSTNTPIYLVAEQLGFKDNRYFSRIFLQYTGLLPSEYRAKIRKKHKKNS